MHYVGWVTRKAANPTYAHYFLLNIVDFEKIDNYLNVRETDKAAIDQIL